MKDKYIRKVVKRCVQSLEEKNMPSRVKNQKIYAPGVLLSTFHSPAPLFWFLFLVDHQYNDQADVEEKTLGVLTKYLFFKTKYIF